MISNTFRKKLEFDVGKPSTYKIRGIDGRRIIPLGEIEGLPLSFGRVTVPINVAVIDAPEYEIILDNDWLTKMKANIFYKTTILILEICWNGRI